MTTCIRRPNSTWTRCDCPPCREDKARIGKRHRTGRWSRVPASAVWNRIHDLIDQGYTPAWIESAAGTSPKLVEHALSVERLTGHRQSFGSVVSAALVSADMSTATRGRRSATGTTRRLRALAVMGWTLDDLAERSGLPATSLGTAQRGGTSLVGPALWRGARDLYDALSEVEGPSTLGRTRAENRGWLAPIWWDDPDTDPEPSRDRSDVDEVAVLRLVQRRDPSVARTMSKPERIAATKAWRDAGFALAELERLTGWRVERYTHEPAEAEPAERSA